MANESESSVHQAIMESDDLDICPLSMNLGYLDETDITEPISETGLVSLLTSELVIPGSEYKFTAPFKSVPTTNPDLDQEYTNPVTHSQHPVHSYYYSPVQQLVIGLDFTCLQLKGILVRISTSQLVLPQLVESTHYYSQLAVTHYYSQLPIPETKPDLSASQIIPKQYYFPSSAYLKVPKIITHQGIYPRFKDYIVKENFEHMDRCRKHLKEPTEFESSDSFNSSFDSAKIVESFRLTSCPLCNSNIISGSFDHNGGILTNEDGIKITIPKGAISYGVLVNLHLAVGLYGPFILPSNCQDNLASPYYWIGVTGLYHFLKPVQVEFEHFGACDPSHYQLLCCEDDDESYTMRPVGYNLNFKVQDNISRCTFETRHFCSYCLYHNCRDPMINRIRALYLKPANFQCLNHFKVEIWFTFPINYCLKRNKELYSEKGMVLDEECTFKASTHINSTSFFGLSHVLKENGWSLDHSAFSEIRTHEINFYNFFETMGDLKSSEENSQFPPRFIVNVARNYSPRHCKPLDTKIKVTLYNTREVNSKIFELFVPLSILIMADCSDLCDKNKATLSKLMDFVRKISPNWEELALKLELPEHEVEIINLDHQNSVVEKCKAMFKYWLRALPPASWCHLVQALYAVGLYNVAEEVTAAHLQNFHSSASGIALSDEDKSSLEDIPVQIESTIQGLLCESSLLSTTLCKRTSKGKSSITKRAKITKTTTTPPSLPTTSSEALPSPSTLSSSSSIQQTPSKNRKRPWRPRAT